jgi:hypothetical protein
MSGEFKKASDIVNALFQGFNDSGMQQASSFMRSWREVVGDKIAAHSRVVDVDKGCIVVEVDHPGWSQQILFIKKRAIDQLSRSFPELDIRNMAIRVVSECKTPYKRQEAVVGSGLPRVAGGAPAGTSSALGPDGKSASGQASAAEPDVPLRQDLDDDLKAVLGRLKESIRRGKRPDDGE